MGLSLSFPSVHNFYNAAALSENVYRPKNIYSFSPSRQGGLAWKIFFGLGTFFFQHATYLLIITHFYPYDRPFSRTKIFFSIWTFWTQSHKPFQMRFSTNALNAQCQISKKFLVNFYLYSGPGYFDILKGPSSLKIPKYYLFSKGFSKFIAFSSLISSHHHVNHNINKLLLFILIFSPQLIKLSEESLNACVKEINPSNYLFNEETLDWTPFPYQKSQLPFY